MEHSFRKLGLAVTSSPTGIALLKETKRLKDLFQSELLLIHVEERSPQAETGLSRIIENAGLTMKDAEIIWASGEPANTILKTSKRAGVDLLIAGALEKEGFIKYYVGSVARKIMRESTSSLLILKEPSENPVPFKKFYVDTDFSFESERTIRIAYNFALLENADEFVVVKDYDTPGLASAILDSVSIEELEGVKQEWQNEEVEKLKLFIKELDLKGLEVKTKCLYGKEGWETSNFVKQNNGDIFALTAPRKRLKLIDRVFHHELEYSFKSLPANLLIIR